MTEPVYRLHNEGLGDHWASINLLAHLGAARGRPVHFQVEQRFTRRIIEILRELNGELPMLVPESSESVGLDGYSIWATPYLRTWATWSPTSRPQPTLLYQFDGVSAALDKNPSQSEIAEVLAWAERQGLRPIKLGGQMPLSEVVQNLAACTLFIGSDSGMSHIAHSVNCPTYILEYALPVVTCHRHKNYVLCKGAEHFIQQADTWLKYLRFIHEA